MTGRIKHQMVSPGDGPMEEEGKFGPQERVNEMDPFPVDLGRKKDLDNLFMLGYIEGEKKVGKFTFKLRTLTNEENQVVVNTLNTAANAFEAQDVMLAFAIVSIDNTPFEELYAGGEDNLPPLKKKISIVRKLQSQVVNDLVAYYNELVEESNQSINEEELKK